jgi:hypothetical protein
MDQSESDPDWEVRVQPGTGRVYYRHILTDTCHWNHPNEKSDLPPGIVNHSRAIAIDYVSLTDCRSFLSYKSEIINLYLSLCLMNTDLCLLYNYCLRLGEGI